MAKIVETVSTSSMIAEVANRFEELPKRITKEVIQDFLQTIENEVAAGKKIRIDRIGILQVKERAPRMGRNPQTGEQIKIPASKKIAFRPAKSLKEQVMGARKTVRRKAAAKKKR